MSDLTLYPKQRLSFAEKTKDDYKWAKDVMDNLLLQYSSGSASNAVADEYSRKLANYQLYNNILNQQDFERECNPLGIQVGQFKDTIQPYNKTYNKIQVLLGEELKRPFNYRTVLVNSDGIKSKQLAKQQFLRDFIMYELEKTMSQFSKGEFEMEELNNLIEPSELESYMSTTYLHAKEHVANQILQYLTKKLSIPELKNDAFKHGLIAGEEFIWVGIENGEPVVQVLNPLGVIYHKSPEVKYIDSGLYAGYRTYMNPGDILDKLGDFLEEKQISRLEGTLRGVNGIRDDIISKQMKYHTDDVYDHYLSHYFSNG